MAYYRGFCLKFGRRKQTTVDRRREDSFSNIPDPSVVHTCSCIGLAFHSSDYNQTRYSTMGSEMNLSRVFFSRGGLASSETACAKFRSHGLPSVERAIQNGCQTVCEIDIVFPFQPNCSHSALQNYSTLTDGHAELRGVCLAVRGRPRPPMLTNLHKDVTAAAGAGQTRCQDGSGRTRAARAGRTHLLYCTPHLPAASHVGLREKEPCRACSAS